MTEPVDFSKFLRDAQIRKNTQQLRDIQVPGWLESPLMKTLEAFRDQQGLPAGHSPLDMVDIRYQVEGDTRWWSFSAEDQLAFVITARGSALNDWPDADPGRGDTSESAVAKIVMATLISYLEPLVSKYQVRPLLLYFVAGVLGMLYAYFSNSLRVAVVDHPGEIRSITFNDEIGVWLYPDMFHHLQRKETMEVQSNTPAQPKYYAISTNEEPVSSLFSVDELDIEEGDVPADVANEVAERFGLDLMVVATSEELQAIGDSIVFPADPTIHWWSFNTVDNRFVSLGDFEDMDEETMRDACRAYRREHDSTAELLTPVNALDVLQLKGAIRNALFEEEL